MSVHIRRTSGAVLVYALATTCAWADLTADDVWADWQAYLGGIGYEITGNENRSGGTLTVTDMSMTMALPEEDASFAMSIPEITLEEIDGGKVRLGFPASFPLTITITVEDEPPVRGVLTYSHDGLDMIASGTSDEMVYDYSANSITLALASLEADGEQMPPEVAQVQFAMNGVQGSSTMKVGEMREIIQSITSQSLTYNMAFNDPDSDDGATVAGAMNAVGIEVAGTIPKQMNAADFQNLMDSGFDMRGGFDFGSGNTSLSGQGDGENFAYNSSSQGGQLDYSMGGGRMTYSAEQNATQIQVVGSEIPFPLSLQMAKAGFNFGMPLQAADEEQPFAFGLNLTDFSVPEMLWSMIDPAGALPHDPATVRLSATGMAQILVNFMDPAVAETLERTGAAPGELRSLKISDFLVSAAGTRLSGTGDFTFDNSDLESFDGMPAPAGIAALQLVGANGLLDKLVAMGLVQDSDAMGARMMMGMLAVPGEGPDTLNSTIEITDDGQILANGQRIK